MEEQQFKLSLGKTPAGKELQIVRNTQTNMFLLQYSTGGEVPEDLRDPWNNLEMIKSRGLNYIESLRKNPTTKKSKNAKSINDKAV